LKEIDVRGEIRNPVEYLVKLLETKEFKENNIDTSWLDGILKAKSITVKSDSKTVVTCSAVYRAMTYIKAEMKKFQESLSKGQTAVADLKSINNFPMEIIYEDIKYPFTVARIAKDRLRLTLNGQNINVKIREQPDGSLLCMFGATTRKVYGQEEPLGVRMVIDGSTVMMPNVFDPSELRSDVTGKVKDEKHFFHLMQCQTADNTAPALLLGCDIF
jgi:acetyl-CoA carboxylase/biotin carboxylase 1